MKFTEGYWLRSEDANETYAAQAYIVEKLPDRMRVTAPGRPIHNRGGALDVAVITTEFTSISENVIGVRSYHYEGWISREPSVEKTCAPCPVDIEVGEKQAVMRAGNLTVRVERDTFGYSFEAGGRVLTSCGFRNLGYMRCGRKQSTMLPRENYLAADYRPYMLTELSLGVGECVYGLGERFTAFVKNGQTVDIWNEDGGTASQVSYKNIPFYMTNRGYGVFVDHTSNVSFEVASEKVSYVGFSAPGEELRYMLVCGETPEQVLSNYTAVTGRPALPPAWSFGLWLSTSFTTDYDEKTVSSLISGMAGRDIPLSVFHFDCFWMKPLRWCELEWDENVFPDVPGMLKRYKDMGLKICVWINPYIAQGTPLFREGLEKGYLLARADGMGARQLDNWQPGMGIVDFTNPEASAWYAGKLRRILDMGVDCFKTDFGERIPIDVRYHNGADPVGMHNHYAQLYNECVFGLLRETRGEGEAVLFARSAAAGGQRFPVHWGGDNMASFPSMAESLRGGLSFAMSGFSFWSHDIGGFESTASPDLYKRWVQFGLLSTHSRLHGSGSYRVPWLFDDEACDVLRAFVKLKCRLMPYLYAMAVKAHRTGVPVMRPMALAFPDDPAADFLDRQYMLGDSLLAAPVFSADGVVDYYLPDGVWTHLLSGETRRGGRWFRDRCDYFTLPLYVRDGALLPLGSVESRPDYDYTDGVTLRLYASGIDEHGVDAGCVIPDLTGRDSLSATVSARDGTLTLTLSRPCEGLSFELYRAARTGARQAPEAVRVDADALIVKISL
ncbi:MAG: alpha-xylosidase [Oscillospiraceae bacterium]|nr:alpha-xylosidase [Oscillospiraceae bacterium]